MVSTNVVVLSRVVGSCFVLVPLALTDSRPGFSLVVCWFCFDVFCSVMVGWFEWQGHCMLYLSDRCHWFDWFGCHTLSDPPRNPAVVTTFSLGFALCGYLTLSTQAASLMRALADAKTEKGRAAARAEEAEQCLSELQRTLR